MNREEAIEYGTEWLKDEYLDAKDRAFIKIALEALEQEPKAGHWKRNETIRVTYCSECGFGQYIDEYRTYNYCPNCGAKMESEG